MRTWKQLFVAVGLMLAAGSLSACYYGPYWDGGGPGWHHGDGDYGDHDHDGDHGPGGGSGWGGGHGPGDSY